MGLRRVGWLLFPAINHWAMVDRPCGTIRIFTKRSHAALEGRVTRIPIYLSLCTPFQGYKSRRSPHLSRRNDLGLVSLVPPILRNEPIVNLTHNAFLSVRCWYAARTAQRTVLHLAQISTPSK